VPGGRSLRGVYGPPADSAESPSPAQIANDGMYPADDHQRDRHVGQLGIDSSATYAGTITWK